MTVAQYADHLRQFGIGRKRQELNHSFVDKYPASHSTPMWVSTPHELRFHAVTGVEMVKGFAVIRTTNLAPVQGSKLQRLTEAREELANFETRLQEKRDLVAKLERYAARHDYLPGARRR